MNARPPLDLSQAPRWAQPWRPWLSPLPERSVLLCAGLGGLAQDLLPEAHPRAEQVASAAAGLALLTKLDDQQIDRLDLLPGRRVFEARPAEVRAAAERILAPSLADLLSGEGQTFAGALGRSLRALADSERLDQLHAFLQAGWDLQARALAVMTRPQGEAEPDAVWEATAEVGTTWLLGVALPGWLPPEAGAFPDEDELRALRAWGLAIQAADALCDHPRDRADGLISTIASVHRDHEQLAALRPARALLPRWPRLERRFASVHELLIQRWRQRCSAC